ncbi:MAG: lspA, partial [Rhodospirillaceae bacterium]
MNAGGRLSSAAVAALVLVLDQASKGWILVHVMVPPRVIEITPFFNVVLVWNRGVSFGLFNNDSPYNSYVLVAVSGIVVVFLAFWGWRAPVAHIRLALGAIMGGAIGNAIDRMRHDGVVDFLDFHWSGWHWPAFNGADSAIVIGAAVLVADSLF